MTLAIAAGMVIVFGYMVYVALTCFNGYLSEGEIARTSTGRTAQAGRKNTRANNARNNVSEKESEGKIARSVTLSKMTKVDWIAMAVITLIYAVVAFARLGNMSAPETAYSAVKEGAIVSVKLPTFHSYGIIWGMKIIRTITLNTVTIRIPVIQHFRPVLQMTMVIRRAIGMQVLYFAGTVLH